MIDVEFSTERPWSVPDVDTGALCGYSTHPLKDTTLYDPYIKMPTLDIHGQIAAAQIAFYVPMTAFTIALIYRYAFRRDAGWLFLCIFSLGE